MPHACVVVLHAWPTGQSLAALHPHAPEARHAWPDVLWVQSVHADPFGPHCVAVVPCWQVPPPQQPFVQAVDVLQAFTHWLLVHAAEPAGQSVMLLQPHWPPPVTASHCVPRVLP